MKNNSSRFPLFYRRRQTTQVSVGNITIGSKSPIRIQSMVSCDTLDIDSALSEARRLSEVGCELIRFTAPSLAAVEAIAEIAKRLRADRIETALVADVHFSQRIALAALDVCEKVRINPGNFAEERHPNNRSTAAASDLQREALHPFLRRAAELGRAIRIGVNHGSLSERMVERYGDTPLGMVESALEYLHLAGEVDFDQIVVSMKSSNPTVMIAAYRLLAERMEAESMHFPLHLGVTEAGDGADGRLKSAIGIGALLEEGIGDTIRVSLTEDPVEEIPVARQLIAAVTNLSEAKSDPRLDQNSAILLDSLSRSLCDERRAKLLETSSRHKPAGIGEPLQTPLLLDCEADSERQLPKKWRNRFESAGDMLLSDFCRNHSIYEIDIMLSDRESRSIAQSQTQARAEWWRFQIERPPQSVEEWLQLSRQIEQSFTEAESIIEQPPLLSIELKRQHEQTQGTAPIASLYHLQRLLAAHAAQSVAFRTSAILLVGHYRSREEATLRAAVELSATLVDSIGDGIALSLTEADTLGDTTILYQLGLDLLQGARRRFSRADFISCPSCGRTQFDIQAATAAVRAACGHLKGVRIAVMGCIVNGPGEMADADFGYVGAGNRLIHLYRGRELVRKGVHESQAVVALVELLREHGAWHEPEVESDEATAPE